MSATTRTLADLKDLAVAQVVATATDAPKREPKRDQFCRS